MDIFDITNKDIELLNDEDLRSLIGKLSEADLKRQEKGPNGISYGGDQNAADGGIDVYIEVYGVENSNNFVPRNITGFQVKVPDMTPASIRKEMSPNGTLRKSVEEIVKKKGAYIIACGGRTISYSTLIKRQAAMKDEISMLDITSETIVDYYDSKKIATWVGQYPELILWLRQRIGKEISGWRPCEDWSSNPQSKDAIFYMDDTKCMCKVETPYIKFTVLEGINQIRLELLKDKCCIRIAGLSGTGKTRLIFALFDNRFGENFLDEHRVIYCDIGANPVPTALHMAEKLFLTKQNAILVVDNCSPEEHEELRKVCFRENSHIKLITIEYDVREDSSESTIGYYLEPSSKASIINVLKAQRPFLSESNVYLIANFSDGNYRVALALASTVEKNQDLTGLNDEALFKRLFFQRKDENEELLHIAELIALVYSFDGTFNGDELKILAGLAEISERQLYKGIAELEARKLVQKRGKWKALLPHAIANRLAKRALKNIPDMIVKQTFDIFQNARRLSYSFCHRLSYLHDSEEAVKIADYYIENAINNKIIFNEYSDFWKYIDFLAPVSPNAYLHLVEALVEKCGAEKLERFYHVNFIRAIREIGYNSAYFERSIELLILIVCSESRKGKDAEEAFLSMLSFMYASTEVAVEKKINTVKVLLDSSDVCKQLLGRKGLAKPLSFNSRGVRERGEFGSHRRTYREKLMKEDIDVHYKHVFDFVLELILSDAPNKKQYKQILAEYEMEFFRLLLIDLYIEKVDELLLVTDFVEGWVHCSNFLRIYGDKANDSLKMKVKTLEYKLRPRNLKQRLKVFVLSPDWWLWGIGSYIKSENIRTKINEHVLKLGKQLFYDTALFEEILPELFLCQQTRCFQLGRGIAEASNIKMETWKCLIKVYKNIMESKGIEILLGFISTISITDNDICEQILEETSNDSELQEKYLSFQIYAARTEQTYGRIIKVISAGKFDYGQCERLAMKYNELCPNENEFLEIVSTVGKHGCTGRLITHMLHLQMHRAKSDAKDYSRISDYAMTFLSTDPYSSTDLNQEADIYDTRAMVQLCMDTNNDYTKEIIGILKWVYKRITDENNICVHSGSDFVRMFIKNHSVSLLDIFLPDKVEMDYGLINWLRDRHRSSGGIIEAIPMSVLKRWANQNPDERYMKLVKVIPLFINKDEAYQWTSFALMALNKVEDVKAILAIFLEQIDVDEWNGSRAEAMGHRISLYYHLESLFEGETKEWIHLQMEEYLQDIITVAESEARMEKDRAERFE